MERTSVYQKYNYAFLSTTLFLLLLCKTACAAISLTLKPAAGSTISGSVTISCAYNNPPGAAWVDIGIDGSQVYSSNGPSASYSWSTSGLSGGHSIDCLGYHWNSNTGAILDGTVTNNVTVSSNPSSTPSSASSPLLTLIPAAGSMISGTVTISCSYNSAPTGSWINLGIDGNQVYSSNGPAGSYSWSTSGLSGGHSIDCLGYHWNSSTRAVLDGTVTNNVTVSSNPSSSPSSSSPSPGSTPTSSGGGAITSGPTIAGLTGSPAGIPGADTNPAHYGQYSAPGGSGAGYNLIGGSLLDDMTAASFVKQTQQSSVETGSNGPANVAANNYFEAQAVPNASNYMTQLNAFWSAWGSGDWGHVVERIDGACPINNPTTAMAAQWAANKWGINPILMYAEATQEGNWDQTTLGDNGTSSGVWQVADRGANHAFSGFAGPGSMLARENTCFNADFYAAHLYAAFHGWTNEGATQGDIGASIQSWFSGTVSGPGSYTTSVYNHITTKDWQSQYFGSQNVPY